MSDLRDMLRPELRAALWRWREIGAAVPLLAFGLWAMLATFGILRWLGPVIVILGLALVWTGFQRGRFRRSGAGGGGAGVVQVDERRLAYFGPLSGGIIDLDDLLRVELDPSGKPAHWVLSAAGGQSVTIPVDAAGAEALFDVFATLPGIRTGRMLDALAQRPDRKVTIWQADRPRLH